MKLPKLPELGKVTGLFTAKTALLTVVVGVMVVIPTTLYIAERQKNYEQPVQTTGSQSKDTSIQNTVNEATPERPATTTDTQQPNNQTKTTTQNNSTSNTQPTQSTPTPTPTEPSKPYVEQWSTDNDITRSPSNCGSDSNRCKVGQPVTATASFVDIYTRRKINITKCEGFGWSATVTTGGPRHPATTTQIDSSTCSVTFVAPESGLYFIYVDAYTDENTPVQFIPNFVLAYLWFQ